MPKMSGFDLAQSMSKLTQIVFMSAQASYAVKAFEFDVTDYIQKPVSYQRFLDAVQRAKKYFDAYEKGKKRILFLC